MGNLGTSGGVGVIRNEDHGIQDFSRDIGTTTSLIAEIWALRDWLNLWISMNLEAVEIEVDAKSIVDLVANDNSTNHFINSLVDDCRTLASQIPIRRLSTALEKPVSVRMLLPR